MQISTVFSLLIGSILMIGCGNGDKTSNSTALVQGKVQVYHPHCGGARPIDGDGSRKSSLVNTKFIAFKEDSKKKIMISTDDQGQFSQELPVGNYKMFYAEKINSPQEFLKQKTVSGEFYSKPNDECYQKWLKTPEFTFSIQKDTTINLLLRFRCDVKDNPCIRYIGPARP